MTILINTDNHIKGSTKRTEPLTDMIKDELARFDEYITRIEVHLSDENGKKVAENDIRCLMEARMEGRSPIAVSNLANTDDLAVSGAIDKLKAAMETIIGKARNY